GALPCGRIDGRIAGRQLVLLRREAEGGVQRKLYPLRRGLGVPPAAPLPGLRPLVKRPLAGGKKPPPRGPGLAPVVFEQLGGQPAGCLWGRAREQALAQYLTLGVDLLLIIVDRPHLGGLGPGGIFGPVLDQPVAQRQRRAAIFLVVG